MQAVLRLGQERPQDRLTRPPSSPGGGGMETPDYPGRGHRTRRGPRQKSEEHLLTPAILQAPASQVEIITLLKVKMS